MNPATSAQGSVRTAFGGWSDLWRTLTGVQRDGWATLGLQMNRLDSLGQTYNLTGQQAYASVNQNRFKVGSGALSVAPAINVPPGIDDGAVVADSAPTPLLTVDWTPGDPGDQVVVEATAGVSAGINFRPRSAYKFLGANSADIVGPTDFIAAWTAIYGGLVVGTKIFIRVHVVRVASGQVSPYQYFQAIVT